MHWKKAKAEMGRRAGFVDYIKTAFLWHWNLLAVGAGASLAILSGKPDMIIPLVMAGELLYLGMLATRPRFQKAVDAKLAFSDTSTADDLKLMQQIRTQLKPEAWARFEGLRERCLSLDRLAEQIRGPQAGKSTEVQDLQTESLERLLWMFLKLIYSEDALDRFLRGTNRNQLQVQITAAEKDLSTAKSGNRSDKLQRSIEDKLQTLKQRLTNLERADENRELLRAEIDRIEQKVNAISEMSISGRDPADVSAQVDGIADGVSVTEEAIKKLDMPTLFQRESAPKLLSQRE
jgi:hypothetical protein